MFVVISVPVGEVQRGEDGELRYGTQSVKINYISALKYWFYWVIDCQSILFQVLQNQIINRLIAILNFESGFSKFQIKPLKKQWNFKNSNILFFFSLAYQLTTSCQQNRDYQSNQE